ncbi:hypothetical protein EC2871950_1242 [Escherichia coli 2871950]|nr:hypothetical protein EC2871950_1242 [Escherichia coli 2871950]
MRLQPLFYWCLFQTHARVVVFATSLGSVFLGGVARGYAYKGKVC